MRQLLLFCVDVDKLRAKLGVQDFLAAVQSGVAGEHVSDAAGEREVDQLRRAEQLHAQRDGRDRAVHRAAEHAHKPDRRREPRRDAQQRAEHAAERRPDEERRHDLAALKAAADGDRREHKLPQKRGGRGAPLLQRALDDVHARAVVVPGAHEQRQRHDGSAAEEDAQIAVRNFFCEKMLRRVHRHAEYDAHHRAGDGEHGDFQQQAGPERLDEDGKPRRRNAEGAGDAVRHEGRDDARHERRVVKHADADDLQREERGRQRRAEQRGEHGAHAAERGQAHILFVQTEQPPDVTAETPADLQRRALASGAAAEQMRNDRAQIDARHQQQRHLVAEMDGVDDGVRVFVFHFRRVVQPHDEQTAHRQQPQQPGVRRAHPRRPRDAQVEQGADHAADPAGHPGDDEPLDKGLGKLQDGLCFLFQFVHGGSIPSGEICARALFHYITHFARFLPGGRAFFSHAGLDFSPRIRYNQKSRGTPHQSGEVSKWS